MKRPAYCVQPGVRSCWECSLSSHGLDCRGANVYAREIGARGGRSRSPAKAAAARRNGMFGGRPRKAGAGVQGNEAADAAEEER